MENISRIFFIRQELAMKITQYFIINCETKQLEVYNAFFSEPIFIDLIVVELETIIEKILSITFNWEFNYSNHKIIDGFKWRFLIEGKNNENIEYTGNNRLPVNFSQIQDIIDELTEGENYDTSL